MINVEINNDQLQLPLDQNLIRRGVEMILQDASFSEGLISVAVVDDATITRLHRDYLDLDEPTDVMSFPLQRTEESLEGEIVVSAETAQTTAPSYGWAREDELLLYVIHGALHLVGYDDTTPEKSEEMRRRESAYLERLGVKVPDAGGTDVS